MSWYEQARGRVNPKALLISTILSNGINAAAIPLQVPLAASILEVCSRNQIDLGLVAVGTLGLAMIGGGAAEVVALQKRGMSSNLNTNILKIPIKNNIAAVATSSVSGLIIGFLVQDPVNWAAIGASVLSQNPDLVLANQAARALLFGVMGIAANVAILTDRTKGLTDGIIKVTEKAKSIMLKNKS